MLSTLTSLLSLKMDFFRARRWRRDCGCGVGDEWEVVELEEGGMTSQREMMDARDV